MVIFPLFSLCCTKAKGSSRSRIKQFSFKRRAKNYIEGTRTEPSSALLFSFSQHRDRTRGVSLPCHSPEGRTEWAEACWNWPGNLSSCFLPSQKLPCLFLPGASEVSLETVTPVGSSFCSFSGQQHPPDSLAWHSRLYK